MAQEPAHCRMQGEFWPPATTSTGLYRQEKLVLRSEQVESLETIRRDFNLRKPAFRKSITVGEFIDAAVGFMLRHAEFEALESTEDLDRHVASQVYGRILGNRGGASSQEG